MILNHLIQLFNYYFLTVTISRLEVILLKETTFIGCWKILGKEFGVFPKVKMISDYSICTDNFLIAGLDPLLSELLLNMLKFDSKERFTIQQIRNHPWVMSSPINTGN